MKTTQEKMNWLNANGYEIQKSITGYYRCIKHNEDGTTELTWDDSASDDAYDIDTATEVAYDLLNI